MLSARVDRSSHWTMKIKGFYLILSLKEVSRWQFCWTEKKPAPNEHNKNVLYNKHQSKYAVSSLLLGQVGFPTCTAAQRTEKKNRTGGGGSDSKLPNSSRDSTRGKVDTEGCCQSCVAHRPTGEGGTVMGEGGWVPPQQIKQLWSNKRDWGIETAPYSRSSSSYNSLYLLLLNLKEKDGILK